MSTVCSKTEENNTFFQPCFILYSNKLMDFNLMKQL